MIDSVDPVALRKRVGAELRRHRVGAGRTASEAADELGCSRGKISQMEAGLYRLQHRDVRDLLLFYGAVQADMDALVENVRTSGKPSWWAPYAEVVEDRFAFFLGSEGDAIREFVYEHSVVPELLQTPEYATALTRAQNRVAGDKHDLVAELRMVRQQRLHGRRPLALDVVVEEAALRRPIGGPEVHRAQLERLVEFSGLTNVSIQILPTAVGAHAGMDGKFVVLEFERYSPGVYLEAHPAVGTRYDVDDATLSATHLDIAAALQKQALSQRQSVAFVRDLLGELG
ncbi:helix-turn-helix domain-containing protein [Allosaccharopolyspora coralli]|uniref:helix-turn-helix domain-containing protein n=1 Tax=Allosaccharopolyspora coralli TaxID=2665642 RepID=UPI001652B690|nr:helix-turn-helix transcriptional regulator [Allosaccharopolyspora coralli]